jgi:hypothetical protein
MVVDVDVPWSHMTIVDATTLSKFLFLQISEWRGGEEKKEIGEGEGKEWRQHDSTIVIAEIITS